MKKYIVIMMTILLTACASAPPYGALPYGDNISNTDVFEWQDPVKPLNKSVFKFNLVADKYVIKPVAHTYHYLPIVVRTAVGNFLSNLGEPANVVNGTLQFNSKIAMTSLGRFLMNSTFGLAGFRDVATPKGLKNQDTNFDKTLKSYGVDQGAYLIVPLTGPSSTRGVAGMVVDWFIDPVGQLLTNPQDIAQTGADAIAERDENDSIVDQFYYKSLEPYSATRAAYLQHQAFQ